MLEYCVNIFNKARNKNLKTTLGGAISHDSIEFIKHLIKFNLIDKYETRKVVYSSDAINSIAKGLDIGIKFELL